MQPNVSKTVEHYLDTQLGWWTRLLPWRREIAQHLEEALETSAAVDAQCQHHADSWDKVLSDFGNVQEIALQLRQEHWPQQIAWRLAMVFAAAVALCTMFRPGTLLDLPAMGFATLPLVVWVLFDTLRGSTRWATANRIGVYGCICGTVCGLLVIVTDLHNPTSLGAGMALSLLSALYCVVFFTPSWAIVVILIGISLLDLGLVLMSLNASGAATNSANSIADLLAVSWQVDRTFLRRILTLLLAGLAAGTARFGLHGLSRFAPSVGAAVFLLILVLMLSDMSDPSMIVGNVLLALVSMGATIAACHVVSESSRKVPKLAR